jgi:hypothetical protein
MRRLGLLAILILLVPGCRLFHANPPKYNCKICKDVGIYTSNVGAKEFCYNCKKGTAKKAAQFSNTPLNELLSILEVSYLTYCKFRYDEYIAIEYYETIMIIKDEIRKRLK